MTVSMTELITLIELLLKVFHSINELKSTSQWRHYYGEKGDGRSRGEGGKKVTPSVAAPVDTKLSDATGTL